MFGDDGWCGSCGTLLRELCGPLTLRRTGLSPLKGAWVPNWRVDAICVEESVAEQVEAEGISVDLREVAWQGAPPGSAFQIVATGSDQEWFDHDDLRARAEDRHGEAGASCSACGTWRWMPMPYRLLPPVESAALATDRAVIASPEWFGDGCQSFRQVLVRRDLAELITAASPGDFKVVAAV